MAAATTKGRATNPTSTAAGNRRPHVVRIRSRHGGTPQLGRVAVLQKAACSSSSRSGRCHRSRVLQDLLPLPIERLEIGVEFSSFFHDLGQLSRSGFLLLLLLLLFSAEHDNVGNVVLRLSLSSHGIIILTDIDVASR